MSAGTVMPSLAGEVVVEVAERAVAQAGGQIIGTLAPPSPLATGVLARLDALVVNTAEATTILNTAAAHMHAGPVAAARH